MKHANGYANGHSNGHANGQVIELGSLADLPPELELLKSFEEIEAAGVDPGEVLEKLDQAKEDGGKSWNAVSAKLWLRERGLIAEPKPKPERPRRRASDAPAQLSEGNPGPEAGLARDVRAESAIVTGLMVEPKLLPQVFLVVSPDDFFDPIFRAAIAAAAGLHSTGRPVDAVTVGLELGRIGTADALAARQFVQSIPPGVTVSSEALFEYAGAVRDLAEERLVYSLSREAVRKKGRLSAKERREILARLEGISAPDEPRIDAGPFAWPAPPPAKVYHGLAGEFVKLLEPHTEADPMAVLAQFLIAVGNVVGRKPHWQHNFSKHYANEYVVIFGESGDGRKGQGWDDVEYLMSRVDQVWATDRVKGGMSSGEGFIEAVADACYRLEKTRNDPGAGAKNFEPVMIHPGVQDKRHLWIETEFGATLSIASRKGNSLSGWIRKAWDKGSMQTAPRQNPLRATGAHVSIVGHITRIDVARQLSSADTDNGFANRFLWVCSRRSKSLPHGGNIKAGHLSGIVSGVKSCLEFVEKDVDKDIPIMRDKAANQLWEEHYPRLTSAGRGSLGTLLNRAAPHVMRIAMVYALLDQSRQIKDVHLEAGLAFWEYAEASARHIFGESLGDPDAERILEVLRAAGEAGLAQSEINRRVFSGRGKERMERAMASLLRCSLIRQVKPEVRVPGRLPTIWAAV